METSLFWFGFIAGQATIAGCAVLGCTIGHVLVKVRERSSLPVPIELKDSPVLIPIEEEYADAMDYFRDSLNRKRTIH